LQSRRAGVGRGSTRSGHDVNATFGDYLIPANADVPEIEVVFVGVSAAIANAIYHATGRRIRSLPIAVEQLL
jgi:xanthine dehydrogenase YagR molybdenum-binding subunit